MTQTMLRTTLCLLLLTLPALANAGDGSPINERRPAEAGGVVEIENISGSVTVSTWSRSEIEVTGTLGEGSERLRFEVNGTRSVIEVVLPKGRNVRVKGTDLVIQVPEGSELDISVVSADVELNVDGKVEVACVSGDVNAAGPTTELDVSVVSGRVRAFLSGELDRASIATVSGDIDLASRLTERARLEIESVSGSIDLGLADDVEASFELETFSGKIRNEFSNDQPPSGLQPGSKPETLSGRIRNMFGNDSPSSGSESGAKLEFSTGGTARVQVQAFSGNVLLYPTQDFSRR